MVRVSAHSSFVQFVQFVVLMEETKGTTNYTNREE